MYPCKIISSVPPYPGRRSPFGDISPLSRGTWGGFLAVFPMLFVVGNTDLRQLLGLYGELSRTGSPCLHRASAQKLKKKYNEKKPQCPLPCLHSAQRPCSRGIAISVRIPARRITQRVYPSSSELAVLGRSPGPPGAATTGRTLQGPGPGLKSKFGAEPGSIIGETRLRPNAGFGLAPRSVLVCTYSVVARTLQGGSPPSRKRVVLQYWSESETGPENALSGAARLFISTPCWRVHENGGLTPAYLRRAAAARRAGQETANRPSQAALSRAKSASRCLPETPSRQNLSRPADSKTARRSAGQRLDSGRGATAPMRWHRRCAGLEGNHWLGAASNLPGGLSSGPGIRVGGPVPGKGLQASALTQCLDARLDQPAGGDPALPPVRAIKGPHAIGGTRRGTGGSSTVPVWVGVVVQCRCRPEHSPAC